MMTWGKRFIGACGIVANVAWVACCMLMLAAWQWMPRNWQGQKHDAVPDEEYEGRFADPGDAGVVLLQSR